MMFRTLPVYGSDPRATAEIVNGIMNGKTNNTGLVTLNTGNATTTTINNERISRDSVIILVPVSTAAQADAAPYGTFTSDSAQFAASTGVTYVVEFTDTSIANGVYLSDDSKLNFRTPGIYSVIISLQLINAANDAEYADVWFRVNGVDVPNSGYRFGIPARKSTGDPSHLVGIAEYTFTLEADDYIEIAGAVSSTDISLEYYAADVTLPRPAIHAAVATVKYLAPSASTNVYVSAQSNGVATVTHFSNDTANKTYGYVIVG